MYVERAPVDPRREVHDAILRNPFRDESVAEKTAGRDEAVDVLEARLEQRGGTLAGRRFVDRRLALGNPSRIPGLLALVVPAPAAAPQQRAKSTVWQSEPSACTS